MSFKSKIYDKLINIERRFREIEGKIHDLDTNLRFIVGQNKIKVDILLKKYDLLLDYFNLEEIKEHTKLKKKPKK